MGILFILIGLFQVVFPRAAWYIEMGWKFKDAEPSEGYLIFSRIIGVLICIIGIFNLLGGR